MKYTGYINYIKCKEFDLKINQGAIMDLMTHLPLWADAKEIEGEIYYYFTAQKIIEELPIISEKKRTILANVQVLKEKGLLAHKIYKNKGYYKLTELGKTFIFEDKKISVQNSTYSEESVQKNAYKCAEKCIPGMQNSAYNNNTNYNTTNNNKISKDILYTKTRKNLKNFGELENVKLTEEEKNKLLEKYGEAKTNEYIEKLSLYIGAKGDKYKSHYAVILTWIRNEEKGKVEEKRENNDYDKEKAERLKRLAEYKKKQGI